MLSIPRQGVLYVQSSVDWIQKAGYGASDMLSALLEWIGERGTLVMPSYPFHSTHVQYLESGVMYDLRRTPAAIGLLPEIFRRTSGAVRSLDPDFCVTAYGRDAEAIVGTEPAGSDPFGTDSSYQRMLDRHATHVGLGVSLNTTSFIHLVDSRSESGYPEPVYLDRSFPMTILDAGGQSRTISRKALRPQVQQLTSPSAIVTTMQPTGDAFTTVELNGARFFRWNLDRWSDWCLVHARRQSASGEWPCWLSRLSGEPR
jgi:aminoglycoside N3'-acetyltransferase